MPNFFMDEDTGLCVYRLRRLEVVEAAGTYGGKVRRSLVIDLCGERIRLPIEAARSLCGMLPHLLDEVTKEEEVTP